MKAILTYVVLGATLWACGGKIPGESNTAGTAGTGGTSGGTGASGGSGEGDAGPPPTGLNWSDPTTWPGGRVPVEGDDVTIAAGQTVLLDVSPPALGNLTIAGRLNFAEQDLALSARWIMVHGTLQVGTESRPFTHRATITLTADDPDESAMGMGTRGIMVMGAGAQLELHGLAPSPVWTKLSANAAAGTRALEVLTDVNWKADDELVIAPTDFYRIGHTEKLTLSSSSGRTLQLTAPLVQPRWGVLQYINQDGVTLEPTTSVTPEVIDERAEVGNLTRNITIESVDDMLWRNEGFGAQIMIMNPAVAHVEGVTLRRVGQAGRLARYPFHWHLWSYNTDGTERGDAVGQYLRSSVITSSAQRCVVIHGTNGVNVSDNICYDIKGHAMFLEDAVERRNVFERNLVLSVDSPEMRHRLLAHEFRGFQQGPAGFWLTHPDNTIRDNVAADINGIGFWLSYPRTPLGLSRSVPIEPYRQPFGAMSNNVAHSNSVLGFNFDWVPSDDQGNLVPNRYEPADPFTIDGFTIYKHDAMAPAATAAATSDGSLWNRSDKATYGRFVIADFGFIAFRGSSVGCQITDALVVAETANAANRSRAETVGAASYHGACQIFENVFVGLTESATVGQRFGAFDTSDYYTEPVDKSLTNNHDNVLIDSHPGYRFPSPNITGEDNWSLAGALWDPYGNWGAANNYWVYDIPFLTHEGCTDVVPVGRNGKSCAGPYVGIMSFSLSTTPASMFVDPISFLREDNGSTWEVLDGRQATHNPNFRHAALLANRAYTMRMPATPAPTFLEFSATNVDPGTSLLLAVPYTGSAPPQIAFVTSRLVARDILEADTFRLWRSGDPAWRAAPRGVNWLPITAAASRAEVEASGGDRFWQDSANSLLWLKITGDAVDQVEYPTSHENRSALYHPLLFHLAAN